MFHRNPIPSLTRRDALRKMGAGFGTMGLAGVLAQSHLLGSPLPEINPNTSPLAPKPPHFAPKAKHVIQLFMPGGPSQVDTFDYKPDIAKHAGERPDCVDRKSLRNTKMGLMPSPYSFKQYGKCGKHVSEIFPHTAQCVDDICFIHSMHTDIPEHAGAMMMMNAGHLQPSRPSMGSWMVYGLGTENQAYTGTYVNIHDMKPERILDDLKNKWLPKVDQRKQADLLARLNQLDLHRQQGDQQLEASIQAMEMAFRMQFAVPDAFDTSRETKSTLEMYGNSEYAKGCLLARRLIERGVRTVQLSLSIDGYDIAWDTGHGNIVDGHRKLAAACDQGIAALIQDLKQRGLFDETLIIWGGEFGRAPTSEGQKGRDHDHYGFTTWMAGGGVKGGISYGATDEFGLTAVEDRVHVHDLHATILHLMGLDHERLTYRYSGRDYRLTDVSGTVISDIIA
jgi:hypothetical protein